MVWVTSTPTGPDHTDDAAARRFRLTVTAEFLTHIAVFASCTDTTRPATPGLDGSPR